MQGWPHPGSSAYIGFITVSLILKFILKIFIWMIAAFLKFLHPVDFSEVNFLFFKIIFQVLNLQDSRSREGLWLNTEGPPAGSSLSPESLNVLMANSEGKDPEGARLS